MSSIYPIDSLIPAGVMVYKDRPHYLAVTGSNAPVYNPDLPNCYFTGSVDGAMRLEGEVLVPYGEQPTLNIPGPYAPITPPPHAVTFGGVAPRNEWYVIHRRDADEIAGALGLQVLTSAHVPVPPARGHSADIDAFFVKVAKFYTLNLGDALATKARYGDGSPGRWVLDEIHVRIYWEPDTRVNPKTAPTPYRALNEGERLVFPPMGNPLVTDEAPEPSGGISAAVQKQLDRIEGLLGQLLMRV